MGIYLLPGNYLLKFNPQLFEFTIYKKIKNDYGGLHDISL